MFCLVARWMLGNRRIANPPGAPANRYLDDHLGQHVDRDRAAARRSGLARYVARLQYLEAAH